MWCPSFHLCVHAQAYLEHTDVVPRVHLCVHAQAYLEHTDVALHVRSVTLSFLTLASPCAVACTVPCGPPGPSVHGILQARILERVSMP